MDWFAKCHSFREVRASVSVLERFGYSTRALLSK